MPTICGSQVGAFRLAVRRTRANMLSFKVDEAAMWEAAEAIGPEPDPDDEDYYEPPDDYERVIQPAQKPLCCKGGGGP